VYQTLLQSADFLTELFQKNQGGPVILAHPVNIYFSYFRRSSVDGFAPNLMQRLILKTIRLTDFIKLSVVDYAPGRNSFAICHQLIGKKESLTQG